MKSPTESPKPYAGAPVGGRPSGRGPSAAKPPKASGRQRATAGAAAAAAVGVLVGIVVLANTGGHPTKKSAAKPVTQASQLASIEASVQASQSAAPRTAGDNWLDAVNTTDLQPLTGVTLNFDTVLGNWSKGQDTLANAKIQVAHALPDMILSRQLLAKRAPFPQAPQALDDYRMAVDLYIESDRVEKVATELPEGSLQSQEQNASLRLRDIGDALINQGQEVMKPYLRADSDTGVNLVPPPDVPDWASIQLAVGPPLDNAPPADKVQHYEQTRPQQPLAGWVADVAKTGLPTGSAEAATLTKGSAAADKTLAETMVAAVKTLNGTADPTDGRAASVRVRLGLLADEDAAWAAEAATLAPAAEAVELRTSAQRLALIGDDLWDQRAGGRSTGFPISLLSQGTSTQSGPTSDH